MVVLIVEDLPSSALLLQRVLAGAMGAAATLVHVSRLADAQAQLAQRPFDVVLLDLMLPDSEGLDSFVDIATAHPGTPVVVLTNLEGEELAIEALRRGAQDYLFKDELSGTTLVRSLRYAVERNRREQAEHQVLESQLAERRRLARELHDGVLQSLSSMRLQLQMLAGGVSDHDSRAAVGLERLADVALASINDVRRITRDLHPTILDDRELGAALTITSRRIQHETGVVIQVLDRFSGELSAHAKHALYRIFQEAVRNAVKHAQAPSVHVEFCIRDEQLTLEVRDAGIGFNTAAMGATGDGLGLTSIRERARLMDGSVHIESREHYGTLVRVTVPAGRHFRVVHHDRKHSHDNGAARAMDETVKIANLEPLGEDPLREARHAGQRHLG